MKATIPQIIQTELNDSVEAIQKIVGFGIVNQVFQVKGKKRDYVIRLNEEAAKKIEYQKENWCIQKVANLGIPSPEMLGIGLWNDISFMIQNKIEGQNGQLCTTTEKLKIWEDLGRYASKFHQVKRIEVTAVEENEFHKNWQSKLQYNLNELNEKDSLLDHKILTQVEHNSITAILSTLKNKVFQVGLVHGDLCPRNVIWNEEITYLLDWGTAEINIVPHNEIGLILMSKEASNIEFQAFLDGLGMSDSNYKTIKKDIQILNLLHLLDKYRWAESYDVEHLDEFGQKVCLALAIVRENPNKTKNSNNKL
ncbi:MAG: aminoglycoside phosphotransferase family protein [Saprospiraceae bacterium]